MRVKYSTAVLLAAGLVAGCGASTPSAPRSLCGIKVKASAVKPLLPKEGGQVSEKRIKTEAAPHACKLLVDGSSYFQVKHDPSRPDYKITPGIYTRKQPSTFQGRLGVSENQGVATASCGKGKPPVFAHVAVNVVHDLYTDERASLEKFLNAYMPNVQKHYGCKT